MVAPNLVLTGILKFHVEECQDEVVCVLCTREGAMKAWMACLLFPSQTLGVLVIVYVWLPCMWDVSECGSTPEYVTPNAAHYDLAWSQGGVKTEQPVTTAVN